MAANPPEVALDELRAIAPVRPRVASLRAWIGAMTYSGCRFGTVALALSLPWISPASAMEISCHIHPSTQGQENPTGAVPGPFTTKSTCDVVRQQTFGLEGWCHCAFGFAPPVMPRPGGGVLPWTGENQGEQGLP